MERPLLPAYAANGGFPEPPRGGRIRVVAARHPACGASTRVRLPGTVAARAVRRLRCAGCDHDFDVVAVAELGLDDAALAAPLDPAPFVARARRPRRRRLDPQSLGWKVLSVPVAGLLVVAGLLALRGGADAPTTPAEAARHHDARLAAPTGGAGAARDRSAKAGRGSMNAHLVAGVNYSFALPAGWERVDPPDGATFAAEASDGGADATLWIAEDPELEFPTFVAQSLAQLEALAGEARVVERVPAPTAEDTVVRLAADAPEGQPSYEATLRVAGPYRYYLATSVVPGASKEAREGADLITGSFTPGPEG